MTWWLNVEHRWIKVLTIKEDKPKYSSLLNFKDLSKTTVLFIDRFLG